MVDTSKSLVVVSGGTLRTSIELDTKKRRPKSTPRKPRACCNDDILDPRNFLIRGGSRAYELRLQQMNSAAIHDLRVANEALASELVRSRGAADEDKSSLQAQLSKMELELRTDQERLKSTAERLAEEIKARTDQEATHTARLKEITKRLRDEHNSRTQAEAELNSLKQQLPALEAGTAAAGDLRGTVARLEAIVSSDAAVITDLRARLATAETKLEAELEGKGDLIARLRSAEVQASAAVERAGELARAFSEAEGRANGLEARLQMLQDEHAVTTRALTQEREAHAALRERAGGLQADLAELQASSTVAATQAAHDRAELERVRRELGDARDHEASLTDQLTGAREELLHLRAENAGLKAAADERTRELDNLRVELGGTRERLGSEVEALRGRLESAVYQAENHERVFEENEQLSQRLARAESSLRQKEAVLAEALTSHAAQLEMWRAEATEVAQAASKWKQRALVQQQQLEAREREVGGTSEELRVMGARASAAEADRARLCEMVASLEGRLAVSQHEAGALRGQLQESLAAQAAAARQAESASHDSAQREASADRLSARLAEEVAKTTALRNDLAALTQQQVRELDGKARTISELTLALQREERGRAAAAAEAAQLRTHLTSLERELRTAQVALAGISDEKLRAQEAYESAGAALRSAATRQQRFKGTQAARDDERDMYAGSGAYGAQERHQHYAPPPPSSMLPPSVAVDRYRERDERGQTGGSSTYPRGSLSFGAMLGPQAGGGGGSRPGTAGVGGGTVLSHGPSSAAATYGGVGGGWGGVRSSGEGAGGQYGRGSGGGHGRGRRGGDEGEGEGDGSESTGSTTLERLTSLLESQQL